MAELFTTESLGLMEWKIPRGATGFWHHKEAVLPETNPRAIAELAYQWARNLGGTVEQILPPSLASTYYSAVLAYGQFEIQHVTVLFHRHLPLLALVSHPPRGLDDLCIIEDPIIIAAMPEHSEFQLLACDQLTAPVTSTILSELSATELKQIAFWKPGTIGQVLFNLWDLRGAIPQPSKPSRAIPFAGHRVTTTVSNADGVS